MAKIKKVKEIKSKVKVIDKSDGKKKASDSDLEKTIDQEETQDFIEFMQGGSGRVVTPSLNESGESQDGPRVVRRVVSDQGAQAIGDDEQRRSYEGAAAVYQSRNAQDTSGRSYDPSLRTAATDQGMVTAAESSRVLGGGQAINPAGIGTDQPIQGQQGIEQARDQNYKDEQSQKRRYPWEV